MMKLFIVFFALFVLATSALKMPQIIRTVNQIGAGWKAGHNHFMNEFQNLHEVRQLMGALKDDPNPLPFASLEERGIPSHVDIPPNFDSRNTWPGCIGEVMNQGKCGSCWAFGCSESLSDRFCIHSNKTIIVTLAPLDLVTCDTANMGCQGGFPGSAWDYAKSNGLVTNPCYPYNHSIPTCPPQDQPCLKFVPTPKCKPKCLDSEQWNQSKHFANTAYGINQNVDDIATEILSNGPVEATFDVYEDFLSYKSGVYKHTTGQFLGGHAVKMIGWGVLNGTDYWLCENSWTSSWGDDGYFMILRGVNECGIESGIVAGLPDV